MVAIGTKLGHYEIRSQLGAGGMGEVYRARDTRLGRDVAVKVLPSSFSTDTTRLHRFQQEACAAGALNHPNVLIVHDRNWIYGCYRHPGRQPVSFFQTAFNEQQAQFSPDGKWIAYTSDVSGRPLVYVQTFPASGGPLRVSTAGGAQPKWRRNGHELFYIAPDRKLMSVEVKPGATFEAKTPQPLFTTHVLTITEFRNHYTVTADGQRFLINSLLDDTSAATITVFVNWTAGLKQ
jgi:serine/threonine protein kinase